MGCLCLYLTSSSATFTAGSNAQLDQTQFSYFVPHQLTMPFRRQERSSSFPSCLLHRLYTHHMCFCCAPEDRKKLSQFQKPSDSLFYLSLGIILTLFTSLACSPLLRSLALCVVTAAPYVTRAVTHLSLLTHASPAVPVKKIKIHRAFLCYLNRLFLC